MEPSVGRIVNYHCLEGERFLGPGDDMILPAIITRVYPESAMKAVNLIVFTNQPSMVLTMRLSVAMGLTAGGGWSWPEIKTAEMARDVGMGQASPGPAVYKDTIQQPIEAPVDSHPHDPEVVKPVIQPVIQTSPFPPTRLTAPSIPKVGS